MSEWSLVRSSTCWRPWAGSEANSILLAWHRGVRIAILDDPGYGRLLGTKLVLVLVSVILAAVHGILATRRPRVARPLAVAGVVSSVAIVVFATALVP